MLLSVFKVLLMCLFSVHDIFHICPLFSLCIIFTAGFLPCKAKHAYSTHHTSIKWLSDVFILIEARGLTEWPASQGPGLLWAAHPLYSRCSEGLDGCLQDCPPLLWVIFSLSLCQQRFMCWRHRSVLNWIAAGLITDVSVCRDTWECWSAVCQTRDS